MRVHFLIFCIPIFLTAPARGEVNCEAECRLDDGKTIFLSVKWDDDQRNSVHELEAAFAELKKQCPNGTLHNEEFAKLHRRTDTTARRYSEACRVKFPPREPNKNRGGGRR